jgi:hypothetical protein
VALREFIGNELPQVNDVLLPFLHLDLQAKEVEWQNFGNMY